MKLIRNGIIVNNDKQFKSDILIDKNKIIKIENNIEVNENIEIIDANGCYVFPGFIDPHTHFDIGEGIKKSPDDFETGTKAAIINGTTSIINYIAPNKGESLLQGYQTWLDKAANKSSCNYRFHMEITDWNEDIRDEMKLMPELGITSFKTYMAYDISLPDDKILEVLKEVKNINGLLGVHCENGTLINEMITELKAKSHLGTDAHPLSRPSSVEAEAINRLAYISKMVNYPVMVVHLSSKDGLDEVLNARKKGIKIYAETCPQYLFLDDSKYLLNNFEGAKYVCSPPLRKRVDNVSLVNAIVDGDIQTIATDHCSFNFKGQKDLGINDFSLIPNGAPGVEERPLLIYTYLVRNGLISLPKMVDLLSSNAAKLYGMYPNKGIIQEGSDADIVVFDPDLKRVIKVENQLSNVDYSIFEGFEVYGQAKEVLLNGELVVSSGKIVKDKQGLYAKGGNK